MTDRHHDAHTNTDITRPMSMDNVNNMDDMDNQNPIDDPYEVYADRFDPIRTDRKARRKRKPRIQPQDNTTQADAVAQIADAAGLEGGFNPTYTPSRYEGGWLMDSLSALYDQQLITDVIAQVRGGKEASVYCCTAHASTGADLLAAKVYRPRMFRQLRNDHMYRVGRDIIMADGVALNDTDHREMRAVMKGTAFGKLVSHTSWLMHEFKTLEKLYNAGAAVPRPYASGENVILMGYIGDEFTAAPTLNAVRLERDQAVALFDEALRNVELLLQHGLIHGDLSAYNILYWDGAITLIDFPQVTDIESNPKARFILSRDLVRLCEYFAAQGVQRDAEALAETLWYRYGASDLALEDDLDL